MIYSLWWKDRASLWVSENVICSYVPFSSCFLIKVTYSTLIAGTATLKLYCSLQGQNVDKAEWNMECLGKQPIFLTITLHWHNTWKQGQMKSNKRDSKDIYNVAKDFSTNKCCSFVLFNQQRFISFHKTTQDSLHTVNIEFTYIQLNIFMSISKKDQNYCWVILHSDF